MKNGIHPPYDYIVFRDKQAIFAFLTRSTATSAERIIWTDGREYPLVDVQISSASHPFYTGKQRIMDTAGRVERFNRKYGTGSGGHPDAT
ncbi:MAG: type B 50S ribosomal protein L31 [Actinomycetales bacterium]